MCKGAVIGSCNLAIESCKDDVSAIILTNDTTDCNRSVSSDGSIHIGVVDASFVQSSGNTANVALSLDSVCITIVSMDFHIDKVDVLCISGDTACVCVLSCGLNPNTICFTVLDRDGSFIAAGFSNNFSD